MRTYTGSTSCDDRATRGNNKGKIMVNLKENVRDPEEIQRLNNQCIQYGKPPHYDLDKAQRNIVYESCLTTEEAFLNVFGEAMEAFNSRQKANARKTSLEKELAKLDKGRVKQELIHTMIIQVGNKDSRPDEEECVAILQEYLAEFRRRWPNMRIVNAAIHLDEDTPHLQIYFVPVKTRDQHEAMDNAKKWSGMDVQPSLRGALEQMGYTNDATMTTEDGKVMHDYKQGAMAQWQRDFNGLLDEIALNHGIEIDHYQRGQKVSHQDTLDYQEGRLQEAVQYAKDTLETVQMATEQERETLQEAQEEAKQLRTENNALKEQNEALRGQNEVLEGKAKAAAERAATAEQRANDAEKKSNTLEQKAEKMEQRADAAEQRLTKAETAFSRFMEKVSAWIQEHTGLQRKLRTAWAVSEPHRDKIETRMEETYKRGSKAILGASNDLESLLAAELEVEQGTRVFGALKKAVKEDQDPDELLTDDDFEMR